MPKSRKPCTHYLIFRKVDGRWEYYREMSPWMKGNFFSPGSLNSFRYYQVRKVRH